MKKEEELPEQVIELKNTVLSRFTSVETAYRFYLFSIRSEVALIRGICSAAGACFGFLSLLEVTPTWTSFLYLALLSPEMIKLFLHVDLKVHQLLWKEFEYLFVVISGLIFAGIMAEALGDFRAVVPVTIFLVVLSSQAHDASIPFEQHRRSASLYSLVGSLACFAVYVIFQFGFVPNVNNRTILFTGSQITSNVNVTISNVQFACDRLLTAAFFLMKQAFVAFFYPGTFVTLRLMVAKRVVLLENIPNKTEIQPIEDDDNAV